MLSIQRLLKHVQMSRLETNRIQLLASIFIRSETNSSSVNEISPFCLNGRGSVKQFNAINSDNRQRTKNCPILNVKRKNVPQRHIGRTDADHTKKPYDIVLFGATGVTGQYVLEELVKVLGSDDQGFTFAVAGRNKDILQKVLEQVSGLTGKYLQNVPILFADTHNKDSLAEMCKSTRVLLNCVGPYYIHGEQVIKACIQSGTDHLDVSGEPLFLERIEAVYNKKARQAGVYLVGGCGSPNVLNDMGVHCTRNAFKGDLNSVDCFIKLAPGPKGLRYNVTTLNCALHGFASEKNLIQQRKQRSKVPFPKQRHKVKLKKIGFHSEVGSWCVPFPGSDRSIIKRSLRYNFEINQQRPFQANIYGHMKNLFYSILTVLYVYCNKHLAKIRFFRQLISQHPEAFTYGRFKKGGPSREQVEQASLSIIFVATGWKEKLNDFDSDPTNPPDEQMVAQLTAPEIAYASTAICLVQCCITLLRETENLPKCGGVYTTAAMFSNTSLIDRLHRRNIKFEILKLQGRMQQ